MLNMKLKPKVILGLKGAFVFLLNKPPLFATAPTAFSNGDNNEVINFILVY